MASSIPSSGWRINGDGRGRIVEAKRKIGLMLIPPVPICGLFAPYLAPFNPVSSGIDPLEGASARHWLGTDPLGRDVLSRVIYGARISLMVGIGAAVIAAVIGVPVGLMAGYFRGRIDLVLVQIIDIFIALPGLVLALIVTAMLGAKALNLALVLGFVSSPTVARLVRGQALQGAQTAYAERARAAGGGRLGGGGGAGGWVFVSGAAAQPRAGRGGRRHRDGVLSHRFERGMMMSVQDQSRNAVGAGVVPLLAVEGLSVSFRTKRGRVAAVRDFDLRIRPGEVVALVGESGSGKSTIGHALIRLLRRGHDVDIGGRAAFQTKDGDAVDLLTVPERRMRALRGNDIAMIFQEPMSSLNPIYTIGSPSGGGVRLPK